jgi:hypothetical protein
MLTSGVGIAAGADTVVTTTNAIADAKKALSHEAPKLALVFASSQFDQASVLATAQKELGPEVIIFGGSTAGEISQHGPSMSPSVVVMLIATSDDISMSHAHVTKANENPEAKGEELGALLAATVNENSKLALMLGDGLTVNPSAILRGLSRVLPQLPIAGGSAGDDGKYKQTFQYSPEGVLSSSVGMVVLHGALNYAVGVRHGWNAISGPKKVTKASGTVIQEIDNKPAIALYEEFIGAEQAATLKEVTLATLALSYPLGIKDSTSGEMLLRAPFYVDATGSITCGGEVLEGSEVQLMMGTKESAVDAARHSAEQALAALGTTPKAAIIFSCHVRDTLYASREQSKKEIDAIQEVIGHTVPLAGFYTYAEQAPINDANYNIKMCNNVNHNETIVIVLLGE